MTVSQLFPGTPVPEALRNIADEMEAGELECRATVIVGTEIFHPGPMSDERAIEQTVFDLALAQFKIMQAALE